ncbi:MAG: GtrA family protein [Dokdonella sp.]|uniref:GtrA family protein n=1 Tax=Dokdonella sp. TaxID=2291710 RepID=UPI003F81CABE
MKVAAPPRRGREILRFLAGGASTTAVSYAVYLLLLARLPYVAAYSIAYAVGIAWSYFANTWFVFRERASVSRALAFPLVYAVQYLVGSLLLFALVDGLHVPAAFGPLLVVVLTLPLTYVLSRRIIVRSR